MNRFFLLFSILFFLVLENLASDAGRKNSGAKFIPKRNCIFFSVSFSPLSELVISPIRFYDTPTGTDVWGKPYSASIPYQAYQYNIVSVGLEPRVNLMEFGNNEAIAITAPVSFGIGTSANAKPAFVKGSPGFGSIQVPLIAKLFFGCGATRLSKKKFGTCFGAGFEFNQIGINKTVGERHTNKPFYLPCLTTGIIFKKSKRWLEINFKYGFGRRVTQEIDADGEGIMDNDGNTSQRNSRARSIKFTLLFRI